MPADGHQLAAGGGLDGGISQREAAEVVVVEIDPVTLAGQGKEVPRILLVSTDYADVTVLEGNKLSVSALFKAMTGEAKKAYKTDLDKTVHALIKIMGEFDKINNERKVLDAKATRDEKPSAKDIADLKKDRAELEEREKKANAERDTLLKFERKAA